MSKIITEKKQITNIANAIRTKTGTSKLMSLEDMANSIKTMNTESNDQSDWNAVAGEPGYILNKPFGIESITTLFDNTISFDDDNSWYSNERITLIEGEVYAISWNDSIYECVAQSMIDENSDMNAIALGNLSVFGDEFIDGEPFLLLRPSDSLIENIGAALAILALDGSSVAHISIKQYQIKKLDTSYLNIDYLPEKKENELLVENLTIKDNEYVYTKYMDLYNLGCKYVVYCDDERYETTVKNLYNITANDNPCSSMYIGNISLLAIDSLNVYDNMQPFLIACENNRTIFKFKDENEHKITIYKEKYTMLPRHIVDFPKGYEKITLFDADGGICNMSCFQNTVTLRNNNSHELKFFLDGSGSEYKEGFVLTRGNSVGRIELDDPRYVCSVTAPNGNDDKYRLDLHNDGLIKKIEHRKQIVINMNNSYYYPIAIHIDESSSSVEICDHGNIIEIYVRK